MTVALVALALVVAPALAVVAGGVVATRGADADSAPASYQPIPRSEASGELVPDGENASPELRQVRGCWLVCWRR